VEPGTAKPDGDQTPASQDLTPTLISRWIVDDWSAQHRAQQWVNDRRPYILRRLELTHLVRALVDESYERFARSGLELEIGEVLFAARVLAWTVHYLLDNPAWQDGLLVPAYAVGFRHDLPIDDPCLLVARADYPRLVRLASALTFGLLRRTLGRDVWDMREQQALGAFVSRQLETSHPLSAEFLYLPLVVGGLLVARELRLPDEDLQESYGLIALAREKREMALADNPDLQALLDRLLRQPG
jgi:hypothetical protein